MGGGGAHAGLLIDLGSSFENRNTRLPSRISVSGTCLPLGGITISIKDVSLAASRAGQK